MPRHFIYLIYSSVLVLLVLIVVPRRELRRLVFPSILAGAVVSTVIILLLRLFGLGRYLDYGPFGFMGIPFFVPVAWTAWYVLYFYFMPRRRLYAFIYAGVACGYAVIFANMLMNLGILIEIHRVWVPLVLYPLWLYPVTWWYLRWRDSEKPTPCP